MKVPAVLFFVTALAAAGPVPPNDFPAPKPVTTPGGSTDYWPAFSRDGKDIIFSRRSKETAWQLMTVPADGGNTRPLFDPKPSAVATRVSRSAGGRLAFAGANTLWITDAEGRNPKRLDLKGVDGTASYPSWYPDEEHLLIVAYQKESGGVLYRVDIGSGKATALTNPEEIHCGMPNVSPDGKLVIFAGQKNDGQVYDQKKNLIWIIAGDSPAKPLTPHQGRAATWSPDGRRIAYESTAGSPGGRLHALFLIDPDGRENRRITSYQWDANHPVWSPDGKSLAFSIKDSDNPQRSRIATLPVPVVSDSL
ncbi:PD40 domain-containing protein [Luteolibacter yonseiensis]|uniref:PD40 domain-containing protein n=1 Tax=Luteolibacter yonseiensis TaxID=1144680 RepID=A0A934R8D4_9BACT|nr:PD40 domain-containing protein [Luteolibacter yonseiensis]MBK1817105.1 PD40 domain-containing protein [Luteolibacter yonseiensis]